MRLALAAALLGVQCTAAAAQDPVERRSVLEALRPAIEARLGRELEFVVTTIRVRGGWAFVMAEPQRRGGRLIDGEAIFGERFADMDGLTVTALLSKGAGRWRLVDHAIGATDAWYCGRVEPEARRVAGC